MTEQKIREEFNKVQELLKPTQANYATFREGYLALLNSLEYVGENKVEKLYRLPEGITK